MQRPSIFLVLLLIATFFSLCVAPPNPITDNESDSSIERHVKYNYPFTEKHPYWKAFSLELKRRLKRHDTMESQLNEIRDLDFKLRDSWAVTNASK